ncbi:MAG: SPFH domain-containing protein [Muribaculaceae bacterium]|nr:SPFH domain-containing protein [Muribaculaceae bacterium]
MALIDVVKCEVNERELVYKFPSSDLRIGTQLVVHTGQVAFFVKGGEVMDMFSSGTHTIKTSNIPILNKLINLPFGGNSPFQAEVWFINTLSILNSKWGNTNTYSTRRPQVWYNCAGSCVWAIWA